MIGAHERRLAERVAVDRGARLRGLASERQAEGRSVAARGDYHLRGRGRLVVEHTLLDGLEHYIDRIELQFERDSLREVAMAELLFVVECEPAVAAGLEHREFVARGLDAQPEITALEQRPLVQDVDQTLDAPRFLVELSV